MKVAAIIAEIVAMFRLRSGRCKHCSDMKLIINVLSFPPCRPSPVPRQPGQTVWERDIPPSLVPRPLHVRGGSGHAGTRLCTTMDHVMERECEAILSEMESTLAYLSIQASTNDECEVLRRNAETVVQSALAIEPYVPNGGSLVTHVRVVLDCFQALYESQEEEVVSRGRPRVLISEEQLQFYVEHGFKLCDIARLFGCSRRTVERRMQEYGITRECRYSTIPDEQLAEVVGNLLLFQPNAGEKSVSGFLRAQGIVVQRSRVREALHYVDPYGVQLRRRRVLHRREYHVPNSNALWHVDSHHKLIRWRMVIHGGIDGYSRVVPYLRVAPDNTALTAFGAFQEGVERYGLPSRVRSDHGGENVLIAEYMIRNRGSGRGSMITGRSVHNQHIERLWRDVFTSCVSYFYYLFRAMESDSVLDPDSAEDLLALHCVFLPVVQQQLDSFREGWCHHRTQLFPTSAMGNEHARCWNRITRTR